MKIQLTNHSNQEVLVFDNTALLRHKILEITDSPDEADDVVLWATESGYGPTQYDHEKFTATFIGSY